MMAQAEHRDYEGSGLTIQRAMVDVVRSGASTECPPKIRWGSYTIQTTDRLVVARRGRFRAEFLTVKPELRQGFDVQVQGTILLADRTPTSVLRTWYEPQYEDSVEYEYESEDGVLRVWNVYESAHPFDNVTAAKWTDNAGFWVEGDAKSGRTYHCSAGPCSPPDFSSLVFRLMTL